MNVQVNAMWEAGRNHIIKIYHKTPPFNIEFGGKESKSLHKIKPFPLTLPQEHIL